jgi:hypothetical protein
MIQGKLDKKITINIIDMPLPLYILSTVLPKDTNWGPTVSALLTAPHSPLAPVENIWKAQLLDLILRLSLLTGNPGLHLNESEYHQSNPALYK